MCCMIQLWLRVRNVYRNWIIQHILVIWNKKICDLKLVTWLVTSPKNWWLEWTARLNRILILLWIIFIFVDLVLQGVTIIYFHTPLVFINSEIHYNYASLQTTVIPCLIAGVMVIFVNMPRIWNGPKAAISQLTKC